MQTALYSRALSMLAPRGQKRLIDWCKQHVQTHEGRWYDQDAYPHLSAPGGPCDAFDDRSVNEIWLQFASRLGKTFFGQCATMFTADHQPCPMMFASADAKVAKEVVQRTYGMLERCKPLRSQLRPVARRNQSRIELHNCRMFVAWARSVSTLADKAVKVGHANEIDKWEHQTTSKEADPLKLFDDRFKEFPAHKKIKESTPTIKGRSRIERGRLASTNCELYVPCPHCQQYQTLKMARIRWEHLPNGRSDQNLARKTAHYECQSGTCEPITDAHRGWMVRRGVWCPEGCTVDSEKALAMFDEGELRPDYEWTGWNNAEWIIGEAYRDGPDAGYQLSSLYALSLTWGAIGAEWCKTKGKTQDHRNFINQWLGETWEIAKHSETWEQLGTRIIGNVPRDVVPETAAIVTVGVDVQKDHVVYVATAWGENRRPSIISYGELDTLAQVLANVIERQYAHRGFPPMRPAFTLVDSGDRPHGVDQFCLSSRSAGLRVFSCKGSSKDIGTDYLRAVLGKNTANPGMILVHVDTIRSQLWCERMLHDKDNPDSLTLHAGDLYGHQDLLEQLLNDAAVDDLDSSNNVREKWQRISDSIPNDFRDALRYSYVAMLVLTRGKPIGRRQLPKSQQQEPTERLTTVDGRPYLITER